MNKTPRALRTDGEITYNRIWETAGRLFAASGFAETSSKAIASKARDDLASIILGCRTRRRHVISTPLNSEIRELGTGFNLGKTLF